MVEPLSKVCTKCGIEKPLDEFAPEKRRKSGKSPVCQECTKAYAQAYYEGNKEHFADYNAQRKLHHVEPPPYKVCRKCKELKPIEDFGVDNGTKDGKATRCLECKRAENAQHRIDHPESGGLRAAKWRQEHPDKHQESVEKGRQKKNKRRRELHLEQKEKDNAQNAAWYETNKASRKLTIKAWFEANPDYSSRHSNRRRARKRNLPDTWTAEQQAFMLEYWHDACAACGNPKGFFWTLANDHWLPLASPDCPGTIATNMIPLCHGEGGCNNSKYKSEPHAWLLRRFGPKKAAKIEKAVVTYFAIVAARFGEAVAS